MEKQSTVRRRISLGTDQWDLDFEVDVPIGPIQIRDMLPFARSLSDSIVNATVQLVEAEGKSISCKKGCGACCRHLVAVSAVEARSIRELVDALPEPRRTAVRERFRNAVDTLGITDVLERLRASEDLNEDEYLQLCRDYYRRQVPCPFLEEESCSIHIDRPAACREHLVTSPAADCAGPEIRETERVQIPIRIFKALSRCQQEPLKHVEERWVPMILALEWSEAHPNDPPAIPGERLFREFLSKLTPEPPNQ